MTTQHQKDEIQSLLEEMLRTNVHAQASFQNPLLVGILKRNLENLIYATTLPAADKNELDAFIKGYFTSRLDMLPTRLGPLVASITFTNDHTMSNGQEILAEEIGTTAVPKHWTIDAGAPTGIKANVGTAGQSRLGTPQLRPNDGVRGFVVQCCIPPWYGRIAVALTAASATVVFDATPRLPIADASALKFRVDDEIIQLSSYPADDAVDAAARTYGIDRGVDSTVAAAHDIGSVLFSMDSSHVELFDEFDFPWGKGGIFNSGQTANVIGVVKTGEDDAMQVRHLDDETIFDGAYIALFGRRGRVPAGCRVDIMLKQEG